MGFCESLPLLAPALSQFWLIKNLWTISQASSFGFWIRWCRSSNRNKNASKLLKVKFSQRIPSSVLTGVLHAQVSSAKQAGYLLRPRMRAPVRRNGYCYTSQTNALFACGRQRTSPRAGARSNSHENIVHACKITKTKDQHIQILAILGRKEVEFQEISAISQDHRVEALTDPTSVHRSHLPLFKDDDTPGRI